jgi:hypothetical protein
MAQRQDQARQPQLPAQLPPWLLRRRHQQPCAARPKNRPDRQRQSGPDSQGCWRTPHLSGPRPACATLKCPTQRRRYHPPQAKRDALRRALPGSRQRPPAQQHSVLHRYRKPPLRDRHLRPLRQPHRTQLIRRHLQGGSEEAPQRTQ